MSISGYTNTVANSIRRSYTEKSAIGADAAKSIASGNRLHKASTDASSLAMSENIRAKVGVLKQAVRNVNQGMATLNIAIGGMQNILDTAVTMKALAAKANNEINDAQAFAATNAEFQKLLAQIDSIAATTRSGADSLLQGGTGLAFSSFTQDDDAYSAAPIDQTFVQMDHSLGLTSGSQVHVSYNADTKVFSMQIDTNGDGTVDNPGAVYNSAALTTSGAQDVEFAGTDFAFKLNGDFDQTLDADDDKGGFSIVFEMAAGSDVNSITIQTADKASDTITLEINDATTAALGLTGISVDSRANAAAADAALEAALTSIQNNVAELGAQQRQLESAVINVETSIENNEATRAVYAEADVAEEITNLTQANVFAQLSTQMMTKVLEMQQGLANLVR